MSLPLRMLKKSRKAVQRRPCAWEGPQPPKVLIGLSLLRDLLWNSLLMVPDSIVSLFYLLLWQQFVHSWVLDWWAQSWSCCPYAPSQEQVHSESDSPGAIYRVVFLTGPPLKMSLDWPPLKMPRLAPPKSCKYENHIKVLRHLDFFWS